METSSLNISCLFALNHSFARRSPLTRHLVELYETGRSTTLDGIIERTLLYVRAGSFYIHSTALTTRGGVKNTT